MLNSVILPVRYVSLCLRFFLLVLTVFILSETTLCTQHPINTNALLIQVCAVYYLRVTGDYQTCLSTMCYPLLNVVIITFVFQFILNGGFL